MAAGIVTLYGRPFTNNVSVTPSTSVRVGGNVVGKFHDICSGGAGKNLESGRAGSCESSPVVAQRAIQSVSVEGSDAAFQNLSRPTLIVYGDKDRLVATRA